MYLYRQADEKMYLFTSAHIQVFLCPPKQMEKVWEKGTDADKYWSEQMNIHLPLEGECSRGIRECSYGPNLNGQVCRKSDIFPDLIQQRLLTDPLLTWSEKWLCQRGLKKVMSTANHFHGGILLECFLQCLANTIVQFIF